MNVVDMAIDKFLYKKIDIEISETQLKKTFINTATEVTTEVTIGTFLYKVSGNVKVHGTGYGTSAGATLTLYIYDGATLINSSSVYAPTSAHAEVNITQNIQAMRKYTVKAKIDGSGLRYMNSAYVDTYLHDKAESYFI